MARSKSTYCAPKGAGKGVGNGNPVKRFGAEIDAKEANKKAASKSKILEARAREIMAEQGVGFIRAKALAWREMYPDEAAQRRREAEIKEMIQAGTEDALDAMHEIILDKEHKDRLAAAKAWVEQDIGRAKQAVEVGGKNGTPIQIRMTQDDAGVL